MDIMNTTMPVGIDVFTKLKFPNIGKKKIDFLISWRDTILSKMPFTGWNSVMEFDDKKTLITAAQMYSNYLETWADERELALNGGGKHISDDKNFDDGNYRD